MASLLSFNNISYDLQCSPPCIFSLPHAYNYLFPYASTSSFLLPLFSPSDGVSYSWETKKICGAIWRYGEPGTTWIMTWGQSTVWADSEQTNNDGRLEANKREWWTRSERTDDDGRLKTNRLQWRTLYTVIYMYFFSSFKQNLYIHCDICIHFSKQVFL